MAVLSRENPETAAELDSLATLIQLAAAQKREHEAARKKYEETRRDIEALMRKHQLVGVPVAVGTIMAEIVKKPIRAIVAKKLFAKITRADFWTLAVVPIGKAEDLLGKPLVAECCIEIAREELHITVPKR